MEQRLCEAAIEGNVGLLDEIIKQDEHILDKIVVGCFKGKNPLHVAASIGRTKFVQELLRRKPELAKVLDSRQQSALHLASAEGHVDIVQALIKARPEMCLALDGDGRNALHAAAMHGNNDVLAKLVQASPHAAQALTGSGDTILHLCVKYDRFSTLEMLLQMVIDKEFVNAKDGGGRTILHLAVSGKQFEILEHVLKNNQIDKNATNANGHTAMDIMFMAKSERDSKKVPSEGLETKIEDFLRKAKVKSAKDLVHGEWITKKMETLMIVASLIATMAFQAGVNPPGGVWQDNSNGHRAGEAVMAYNYPDSYPYFLRSNTIGFVASLSTILLLISGLPFKKMKFMWILVAIMGLTITSMAFTYAFSIVVVTPKKDRPALSTTIVVAVIVWCSVMALFLLWHIGRSIFHAFKERQSRKEAIKRIPLDSFSEAIEKISTLHKIVKMLGVGRKTQGQSQPSA